MVSISRIQLMDDALINHIKAGQVIERPAAALKELLENSYDAGATEIVVTLEKSGLQFLQVTDNGHGICFEDLELAVSRHASSKLKNLEELNHILTMGFRGEALAAIASVSQFSLSSQVIDATMGYQIVVAGGHIKPIQVVAHPQGTTVKVAELFYNTPVRRKFLRSERTEIFHIETVLRRFAINATSVGLKVVHNQKKLYHFPPAHTLADITKRFEKLLGNNFLQQAIAVNFSCADLHVSGWISLIELSSLPRREAIQYLYLNNRPISDRNVQHAIKLSYASTGQDEKSCNYILYLTIDPNKVDVNVHPTKQEVRFLEPRLVHDVVARALIHAFTAPVVAPDLTENFLKNNVLAKPCNTAKTIAKEIFDDKKWKHPISKSLFTLNTLPIMDLTNFTDIANKNVKKNNLSDLSCTTKKLSFGKIMCLLASELCVLQCFETNRIFFINMQNAQSFLTNLKINSYIEQDKKEMHALLLPVVVPIEIKAVETILNSLHKFGIYPEDFSNKKLIIRNIPTYLQSVSAELFFNRFFEKSFLSKISSNIHNPIYIAKNIAELASIILAKINNLKDAETLLELLLSYSEIVLKKEKILQCMSLNELNNLLGLHC